MTLKTKVNSIVSYIEKGKRKTWRGRKGDARGFVFISRERESHFSLDLRAIRPSAVFGTRRKTALRGEGFAWVPDLRSLDKLQEVGVSPYLGFTLYLSVFQCFGYLEAYNGRLIVPKPWDQIDIIFGTPNGAAVTATTDLGC